MPREPIYLDYNATTPVAPAAQQAMLPFLAEQYGNPSSTHVLGRASTAAVADARGRVAALLGAEPDEIVFTSGGSESNNLALKGLFYSRGGKGGHLIISVIEHPAIEQPARFLSRLGVAVTVVGVDRSGVVDPDEVARAVRSDTFLVSIMHANNEIGTIQPIAEIARRCHAAGVPVHTDAAQSVGKIPVRVDELGVDLLTVAGHKLYAPKGVGALYVRRGLRLEPLIHGAGHESGRRAGTENVAFIVALGAAAEQAVAALGEVGHRTARLRDRLLARLEEGIGRRLVVHGAEAPRLPNTLSVSFPGVAASQVLERADHVCASTGAACHSGAAHVSGTLRAIGAEGETALGTVRLSLGWYTTEDEVDRAADALIAAWHSAR